MAASNSIPTSTTQNLGAGPSGPPPQRSSEDFPLLSRASRASQAKTRRARAAFPRSDRLPPKSNTANTGFVFGNAANNNNTQRAADAWQGPQFLFFQPMGTQQLPHRTDASIGVSPMGSGHVASPTCPPDSLQRAFPLIPVQHSDGSCHVADPRAVTALIRANYGQRMADGHISLSTWPPVVNSGVNFFPLTRGKAIFSLIGVLFTHRVNMTVKLVKGLLIQPL